MSASVETARWIRRRAASVAILLAAALASAPILFQHPLCGGDFEFHLVSWLDAQRSWMHGVPFPHWSSSPNWGAGEPRFVFYPPLTWMLGAALGLALPWRLVPAALTFLLLAATGFATRSLARQALDEAPATLAGCAAIFCGYSLYDAYDRAAYAELAGGFCIPLVLLFALAQRQPKSALSDAQGGETARLRLLRRALDGSAAPLALVVAASWLTDAPVGVMACYLLAAVALAAALLTRSWAPILRASVASVLGIALTAAYLLPAAWEQRWVNIRSAIDDPLTRIEDNWLFLTHSDPAMEVHDDDLHTVSVLALCMVAVAFAFISAVFIRQRFSAASSADHLPAGAPGSTRWWILMALIPPTVLFLQFPVSAPVWNLLPKLRFLQFPWRWLLALQTPMAVFFAAAVWPGKAARRWQRSAVAVGCAALFFCATAYAAKCFFWSCSEPDGMAGLLQRYSYAEGYVGTEEYEPLGSDKSSLAPGFPEACLASGPGVELSGAGSPGAGPAWQRDCQAVAVAQRGPAEGMRIATVASHAGFLILRLHRFPAWRINVNGQIVHDLPNRADGLIAVPVPQGKVDLTVEWTATPDAIAGRWLSGLAVLALTGLWAIERKLARARLS